MGDMLWLIRLPAAGAFGLPSARSNRDMPWPSINPKPSIATVEPRGPNGETVADRVHGALGLGSEARDRPTNAVANRDDEQAETVPLGLVLAGAFRDLLVRICADRISDVMRSHYECVRLQGG